MISESLNINNNQNILTFKEEFKFVNTEELIHIAEKHKTALIDEISCHEITQEFNDALMFNENEQYV